jgi:glycosyltransferase involved in cell wall biosynthesis
MEYAEVFGINIIEAMATGTPVIATKSGATPEVIKDSVTGFVVDFCSDVPEAIKKIDSIDPKNCRKWVEENFTKELMARRYSELCKRVLDGNEW